MPISVEDHISGRFEKANGSGSATLPKGQGEVRWRFEKSESKVNLQCFQGSEDGCHLPKFAYRSPRPLQVVSLSSFWRTSGIPSNLPKGVVVCLAVVLESFCLLLHTVARD